MTQWSLSHSPLACFMTLCLKLTNQHTHHPILFSWPATPSRGVLLGLLCNYIKFWYFCVFALLPQKFTFLRLGLKTLKDKLFWSFNEVFTLMKFGDLVVITWSSDFCVFTKWPQKFMFLHYGPKVEVIAFWPKCCG